MSNPSGCALVIGSSSFVFNRATENGLLMCSSKGASPERESGTYQISIDPAQGMAEIRLVGLMPPSEHVKARKELLEICHRNELHKILVDATKLLIDPQDVEVFEFMDSWRDIAHEVPLSIAGVFPESATPRIWLSLGIDMRSTPQLQVQAFSDIDEAKAWLSTAGSLPSHARYRA